MLCTCEKAYYVHVKLLSSAVNRTFYHELIQSLFDFQFKICPNMPMILVSDRFLTIICGMFASVVFENIFLEAVSNTGRY